MVLQLAIQLFGSCNLFKSSNLTGIYLLQNKDTIYNQLTIIILIIPRSSVHSVCTDARSLLADVQIVVNLHLNPPKQQIQSWPLLHSAYEKHLSYYYIHKLLNGNSHLYSIQHCDDRMLLYKMICEFRASHPSNSN